MVFPKHHIDHLNEIFVRKDNTSTVEDDTEEEQGIVETDLKEEEEKAPELQAATSESIDGEPVEDIDGEPIEDLDGEPMEDLDGEPMEDDEEETQRDGDDQQSKPQEIGDMFA